MTYISIDRAIELFGVFEGIKFWFMWRIIVPIELFYYKKVIRKKWCSWHGYKCKGIGCEYPHYDKPLLSHLRIDE